jgi:beta-glucosidase
MKIGLGWKTPAVDSLEAAALETAKKADLVVYVGGLTAGLEGEEMDVDYDGFSGGDRQRIELPDLQLRFMEKLRALGKPMVFVNMSGSAVAIQAAHDSFNAVIQAWYPGQAGGTAIAETLTGANNPSGRLPITFYRATEDMPEFADYRMEGRTYKYFKGLPLYPFGHGLSYARFEYTNLALRKEGGSAVAVMVDVMNAGDRGGDEVVQLYAVAPESARPRAAQTLCGFRRLRLEAGEKMTVTIVVPAAALRLWDSPAKRYAVPAGTWKIRAAASSDDIRLESEVDL